MDSDNQRTYAEPIMIFVASNAAKNRKIKRITTDQFVECLFEMAKKDGVLGATFSYDGEKISVDYTSSWNYKHENAVISNYEWDLMAVPSLGGSEGIYLDISISGLFYDGQSVKSEESVGTVKTLERNKKALEAFGRLGGNLSWNASVLANGMIGRLTPDGEITKEIQRAEEKRKKKYFFCMSEKDNILTHEKGYILVFASKEENLAKWKENSVYTECSGTFLSEEESEDYPWLDYVLLG